MEIKDVQVLKPFGPLVMMAQLPEGFIKKLNGIADVVKEKGDMGPRLAGVIKKESEIPHSMLEEKKVWPGKIPNSPTEFVALNSTALSLKMISSGE